MKKIMSLISALMIIVGTTHYVQIKPIDNDIKKLFEEAKKLKDIPSILLLLNIMVADAAAKKEKAPTYNLCDITIPNTNIFCTGNKDIPRIQMPQLIGNPAPNSAAYKKAEATIILKNNGKISPEILEKTVKTTEVNAENEFKDSLKKQGYIITEKTVPALSLKATQNELVGPKVSSMWWALKDPSNKYYEGILAPIFVSNDGYILDGHHRWAAVVAHDYAKGVNEKDLQMPVLEVNTDIMNLVNLTNKFADSYGILQKAG